MVAAWPPPSPLPAARSATLGEREGAGAPPAAPGRSSRRSSGAAQRTRVLTSSSGSRTSSSRARPGDAAYYPARSELCGGRWRSSLAMRRRSGRSARWHSPATSVVASYGRRAARIAPYSALHYGVIGDAMIELGRYEGAFAAFDRMVELRPSSSAYARVSYARELLGRPQEAEEAMRLRSRRQPGTRRSAWVLSTSGSSPSHRARPR